MNISETMWTSCQQCYRKKKQEDFQSYKETINCYQNYYLAKLNRIFKRATFNKRNQFETDTAEEWIMDVITLRKKCIKEFLKKKIL